METFHLFSYLMPIAAGLLVPAMLAWARSRDWGVLATSLAGAASFFSLALLLILTWFFTRDVKIVVWLKVVAFSAGCTVIFVGVFCLLDTAFVPPHVSQIVCALLAVVLFLSVFALGPVVRNGQEVGMPGEEFVRRINLITTLSPYPAMAYSIFEDDPLRRPILYKTDAADYVTGSSFPWWRTAGTYFLWGFFLIVLSLLFWGAPRFFTRGQSNTGG